MKNHHEVGYFKYRLMILLLSLFSITVMAGESIAATNCSTCHGMPPVDSAAGDRVPATGAFKGSHQLHVIPAAAPADCVVCHSDAAGYDMKHSRTSGNVIKISANINGGAYSKGTFFNQTSVPVTGSCSNVSCHSDVYGTGSITTPAWGTPGSGCSTCHTVSIGATGPNTGSHSVHNITDCTQCHAAGTSSTSKPTTGHLNNQIDVTNGYPVTSKHAAGSYSGSCSTASCHANVYGAGTVATPVWGTTGNGCSACHSVPIGPNGPNTGSHTKHAGILCTNCHAAGTTATTAPSEANGHRNGTINIYNYYSSASVAKHTSGINYTTCSSVYCHSNGKSGFTKPRWGSTSTGCNFCHPTLSAGHNIHISNLLSEVTFYGYTSTKSVGSTYKFGCSNCHPINLSNHMNNTVEVDLTAATEGGHLKVKNGAGATFTGNQCSNVYCHSNGYKPGATFTYATTPVWGGAFAGDRCAGCHGNSPNSSIAGSPAHSVHVVGIHYDNIFNGSSKKLPYGGGSSVNAAHGRNNRSTTINCNICHAATVTSFANDQNPECSSCHKAGGNPAPLVGNLSVADTAMHVNGNVDVVFINQKLATKAQLSSNSFAGYTASASGWARNSNGMPFKTYTSSYDYTKSTLFAAATAYNTANGCLNVACHASVQVRWTDTVTCSSCHTRLR